MEASINIIESMKTLSIPIKPVVNETKVGNLLTQSKIAQESEVISIAV